MKRFIFAYITFACVFLLMYSTKPKYESDQVGTWINTSEYSRASNDCTSGGRHYVYLFQRPDKSTYYLCSQTRRADYETTNIEHYRSSNEKLLMTLILSSVIALCVYFFKPFVQYLNSNE